MKMSRRDALKPAILQQVVRPTSDFCHTRLTMTHDDFLLPKFHDASGEGDPYAQIDRSTQIDRINQDKTENWCETGY